MDEQELVAQTAETAQQKTSGKRKRKPNRRVLNDLSHLEKRAIVSDYRIYGTGREFILADQFNTQLSAVTSLIRGDQEHRIRLLESQTTPTQPERMPITRNHGIALVKGQAA